MSHRIKNPISLEKLPELTASRKKTVSTLLKIGVSVLLLYFVFTKISFQEIWATLKKVNLFFILLATLFFILSQWVSAKRLLLFFKAKSFFLSDHSNTVLYLIGMFYNFFIPGGIGGDAYKVFVLNKKFKWSVKQLSAIVFLDRFMGLTAIGILVVLMSFNLLKMYELIWLLPLALLTGLGAAYFFVRKLFPSFLGIFSKTLIYSLGVQILQVAVLICIIFSLENPSNFLEYVFVFLISSVLSIFSFSGIGVREFVFLEAAQILSIDPSTAVTVGILFSVITAAVSTLGAFYHFKTPELTLSDESIRKGE